MHQCVTHSAALAFSTVYSWWHFMARGVTVTGVFHPALVLSSRVHGPTCLLQPATCTAMVHTLPGDIPQNPNSTYMRTTSQKRTTHARHTLTRASASKGPQRRSMFPAPLAAVRRPKGLDPHSHGKLAVAVHASCRPHQWLAWESSRLQPQHAGHVMPMHMLSASPPSAWDSTGSCAAHVPGPGHPCNGSAWGQPGGTW